MNNRLPLRDLYKQFLCTQKGTIRAYKVSTGWIYHTRDIYRCYVQDRIIEFARFDESQTQRQVNAFIMSGLYLNKVGGTSA